MKASEISTGHLHLFRASAFAGPFLVMRHSKCPARSNPATTCRAFPAGKLILIRGAFELASDRVKISGADPKAVYCGKSIKEIQKPFIVIDGVTYINAERIKEASVESRLAANWSIRVQLGADGRPFAAGFGIGELEGFEFNMADQVKEVIRSELRQGGLLWRSR